MKAGFGSRDAAVKAVVDGEAEFEDLSGLISWVRSDVVMELGQDPDWPTTEMHDLWTTFVGRLDTARVGRWGKSHAKATVRWFDGDFDRGGLTSQIVADRRGAPQCFRRLSTSWGEADVSVPASLQGVLQATVSEDGTTLEMSYIGPQSPFGASPS